jgi:hypothetical protein
MVALSVRLFRYGIPLRFVIGDGFSRGVIEKDLSLGRLAGRRRVHVLEPGIVKSYCDRGFRVS